MQCPKCKKEKQRVVDVRPMGDQTYRKRICLFCGCAFITYEQFSHLTKYKPRKNKRV